MSCRRSSDDVANSASLLIHIRNVGTYRRYALSGMVLSTSFTSWAQEIVQIDGVSSAMPFMGAGRARWSPDRW